MAELWQAYGTWVLYGLFFLGFLWLHGFMHRGHGGHGGGHRAARGGVTSGGGHGSHPAAEDAGATPQSDAAQETKTHKHGGGCC